MTFQRLPVKVFRFIERVDVHLERALVAHRVDDRVRHAAPQHTFHDAEIAPPRAWLAATVRVTYEAKSTLPSRRIIF